MTKVIKIGACDESCPYYNETPVYDDSSDIRCMKVDSWNGGRKIPQWEEIKLPSGYIKLGKHLAGIIPDWCPLEEA